MKLTHAIINPNRRFRHRLAFDPNNVRRKQLLYLKRMKEHFIHIVGTCDEYNITDYNK